MPSPALAHLAKARHIDMARAEHLWNKAKGIVSKEYGSRKKVDGYWALVMGITKKMMGMNEALTEEEQAMAGSMENLVSILMKARDVAHMWHWKVKTLSLHLALGDLYEGLLELVDEMFEMYMGEYGTDAHVELSNPNGFSEQDPIEFIRQLHEFLRSQHDTIHDAYIVNKFEEIQALVARAKYKMENLK